MSGLSKVDALLGDAQERPLLLAGAEATLEKELTPSQRESIIKIQKHVTVWDEIAGCGKTLKMLLLAMIAINRSRDALVIFAATTHKVASAFEEIARKVFDSKIMLPLRVASNAGGVVDYGVGWFQQVVDAAVSYTHLTLPTKA